MYSLGYDKAEHRPVFIFFLWFLAGIMLLTACGSAQAGDKPLIRLGVPTWPGITVQSAVAARLLNILGYETKTITGTSSFILYAMSENNVDVYFGGWMPTEAGMIEPLAKKGKVEKLTTNISGAFMGLAVPKYVWEAGVHTVNDLQKFADKFDHKIYSDEPGTGINVMLKKAIHNNRHNLGNWNLITSSTSAELVAVGRHIKKHKWVVFYAWQPHWMNIKFDMKYLEPVGKPIIAGIKSDVLTVVNPKMVKQYPDVKRFLAQYQISKRTMGKWILEYSYNDRPLDDITNTWIAQNIETVAKWLKGVKARNGEPAISAVKAKLG